MDHARMIDRLAAAGVAAVAFDFYMEDENESERAADAALSDAIRRANQAGIRVTIGIRAAPAAFISEILFVGVATVERASVQNSRTLSWLLDAEAGVHPARAGYSGRVSPEPPISLGRSFILGRPSLMRRTVSA